MNLGKIEEERHLLPVLEASAKRFKLGAVEDLHSSLFWRQIPHNLTQPLAVSMPRVLFSEWRFVIQTLRAL